MKKQAVLLFFVAGLWPDTECSKKPTTFIKNTWDTVSTSVSSVFERSESMFFSREIDIPEKSRITIKNVEGTVAIARSKNPKKLFIEAEKRGKKSLLQLTQILVQTKELTTTIETKITEADKGIPVYYTITAPDTVTVIVEQQNGDILIRDVGCPLSLQISDAGSMTIEQVRNSVTARALKGNIALTIGQQIPETASIFLEAYNTIELKLPKTINAKLSAKTTDGLVTCELPVTLEPITTKITREAWKNLRRYIRGDLGRGGPSMVLDATLGNITITALEQ